MKGVENLNNVLLTERIRQSFDTLNIEENLVQPKQESQLGKQKSVPNALWLDSYTNKIKEEMYNNGVTTKNGSPLLRSPQFSGEEVVGYTQAAKPAEPEIHSTMGRFVEVMASLKQSQENISAQGERIDNSQANSSRSSQADFQHKLDAYEKAEKSVDGAQKKLDQAQNDLNKSTGDVSQKKQAVEIAQTALNNAKAQVKKISETLSKQQAQAASAKQNYEAAEKAAIAAKKAAASAPKEEKEQAELKAKELAEKAAQAKKLSEKAANQVTQTKNSLAQASQAVTNLNQKLVESETKYSQAKDNQKTEAERVQTAKKVVADASQVLASKQAEIGLEGTPEEVKKQIEKIKAELKNAPQAAGHSIQMNAQKTNAARLAEVLAGLEALISNTILEEQKSNVAQAKKRMAERADFQLKEQKKADEAAAKAAKVSWWTNLFSKIAGAVLTVVGVVAAAFTGGASLILAGVGLALFVADSIAEAITGKSITGQILGPVMKFIVDMVKKLADVITDALIKAGMDEKIARGLSTAIAAVTAVLVVVLIVAAAVVGAKALLPKIANSITSLLSKKLPMMLQMANKMAPSAAKSLVVTSLKIASTRAASTTAARTAGQTASKEIAKISTEAVVAEAAKSSASSTAHFALEAGAKYTQAFGQIAQGGISGGGSIAAADFNRDSAEHRVSVLQSEAVTKAISKTLDDNTEAFNKLTTISQSLIETIHRTLSNENALATRMIQNIRHRGA